MKRILVDMDGVLADVYHRFFELQEQDFGKKLSVKDITGLKEAEAFPNLLNWVNTPGFFRGIPVMPGSQKGLKRLNDNYDVVVVSMATEFPICLTDKQLWLNEYYPYISWKQIVFCGNKNLISADIMIDDHIKNLNNFKGVTIMFTQPHNMNIIGSQHKRVYTWKEIEKLLLP
ncbi:MAG: 5'(3')-deoxyribonucleotidase [Bacteroidetes bacterium]|nr:MAG: 5'(3')-deoxyribonucleotidase [Bacteroidota bacterium]